MALRLGFKINRFFRLYRSKFANADHTKTFSTQNSKLRYTKSGCTFTPNQVGRKLRNNVEQTSVPISTQKSFKLTEQTDLKPDGYMNEMSVIPSDLHNTSVTIRRKFAKSSTQNAITQPLKMPRLANPFPEPVKTLQSDTVSDEEKSRQMQEQVKMEARYHLQMHQEMLLQQKLQKMSQKQNVRLNSNKMNQQPQENQQMNYSFQQPQQMNTQVQPSQPNFRKPKQYAELHQQDTSMINHQEFKKPPREHAINTTEQNADDIKQKRPRNSRCRRKAHTRAARYLRHSWYPRGYIRRQMRKYSTSVNSPSITPDIMTVSEQCDLIMKRLKTLYPEYENLKKPILIPGSSEEKEFLKVILKLIGRLKAEADQTKRPTAPFPSYSEVKTFKCEPKKQENNNITNKDITNNIIFNPGSSPRFYSTRKSKYKLPLSVQKSAKNRCPKFKLEGFNPNQYHSQKKNTPTKQEAPYPAYSEICDDPCESNPTVLKICPMRPNDFSYASSVSYRTYNKNYSTSTGDSKDKEKGETLTTASFYKYYSTSAGDSKDTEKREALCSKNYSTPFGDSNNIEKKEVMKTPCSKNYSTSAGDSKDLDKRAAKKKPPCKSPFPPIPQCDYEGQAQKNKEKKRKKHCPKKEKKCKADSAPNTDSRKIISKIKSWLSTYKPEKDNIKVSRSPTDIDGRETYVIEVCEYQEISPKQAEMNLDAIKIEGQPNREIVEVYQNPLDMTLAKKKPFKNAVYQPFKYEDSHILEMTDPIPVQARNIPDFVTQSSSNNVPEQHPEELKPIEDKVIKQIPVKIKELQVNEIEFKPKEFCVKENIEAKRFEPQLKIDKIPNEFKIIQPKQNIEVRPVHSKPNMGIMPKKLNTIKVKEIAAAQPSRINIVRDFKTKNVKINEEENNMKVRTAIKAVKSTPTMENVKPKSRDFKTININQNIYSKFTDFKVNDIKESRDIAMPEPCPIVTRSVPGLCAPNPGCKKVKGGCLKKKKKEQPKKKCRFKKKRKLPNCDDVKNNKTKTCLPLSIPGLEGKPEYAVNAPKKTYFKKSDNISNFIDIKPQEITVLTNQNKQKNQEFVPFKLKPQFWKKNNVN